jgi:hypothetical protein
MEVRVEADSTTLPDGSYIAVRIGEVQKQTVYDPKKIYRFQEARRFGKIDLYQRVGSCDLVWGADQPEARVCKVVNSSGDTGTRLKVHISRPAVNAKPPVAETILPDAPTELPAKQSNGKGREASAAARRYLQDNDVEGILTGAMRALLKSMPEDVPSFLCNYITTYYADKQEEQGSATTTRSAAARSAAVLPDFREYYGKFVRTWPGGDFLPRFHEQANWPRANAPSSADSQDVAAAKIQALHRGRSAKQEVQVSLARNKARDAVIKASLLGNLDNAMTLALVDNRDEQAAAAA